MRGRRISCLFTTTKIYMAKRLIIPLLATICFPLLCSGKGGSVETQAYEDAVGFLKGIRGAQIVNAENAHRTTKARIEEHKAYVSGPSDVIWDKSLVILARSPSLEGDRYLARLSFFVIDAGGGEDLSCARWRRGRRQKERFLTYLREARDNYKTMSPCQVPMFEAERGAPALQCIAKDQYEKLVEMQEDPESNAENAEAAADCSHMFKPKRASAPR